MYVRDYFPDHYRENKPRQGKPNPDAKRRKGLIFDNDWKRFTHYPAYYTASCQNEKITSHAVSFYYLLVTSIRSVD